MSTLVEVPTVSIPIPEAVLCVNCEHVSVRMPDGRCPRCASEAVINLASVLNRE